MAQIIAIAKIVAHSDNYIPIEIRGEGRATRCRPIAL